MRKGQTSKKLNTLCHSRNCSAFSKYLFCVDYLTMIVNNENTLTNCEVRITVKYVRIF